jgi:competence protein ComFB
MALKDNYDFENLENETEHLVLEELEKQLARDNEICKCQECVLDMTAYALNHTPANYRVSLWVKLYAGSLDPKTEAAVKKAVADAIKTIKKNPSHD